VFGVPACKDCTRTGDPAGGNIAGGCEDRQGRGGPAWLLGAGPPLAFTQRHGERQKGAENGNGCCYGNTFSRGGAEDAENFNGN
jgi:hypothetical protein